MEPSSISTSASTCRSRCVESCGGPPLGDAKCGDPALALTDVGLGPLGVADRKLPAGADTKLSPNTYVPGCPKS